MNQTSLTLAFACLGQRLSSLLTNLTTLSNNKSVNLLILVQKGSPDEKPLSLPDNTKVIYLNNIGLSKSRNAAIKNATTDYIWFLDDDVALTNQDIDDALTIVKSGKADFYRIKIGCIEWQEKTFKQYRKNSKVSRLNLLQVSSIEIIANLGFIKKHQMTFNENIGLGTPYQSCEENNFLIDAWDHGAHFEFIDQVLVRHTCIFEERILATNNIFEIRGATASRYPLIGPLLIGRWLLRYLIKEKKFSYLIALLKGYCRGYTYYK